MKGNSILEAALIERQEYLDELTTTCDLLEQQIKIVQHDVDELLLKLLQSSK